MNHKYDDNQQCLHCAIGKVMSDYIEEYGISDCVPLFAALSDVMGDLLANNPKVFAERDSLMLGVRDRAITRAQTFMDEGEARGSGKLH